MRTLSVLIVSFAALLHGAAIAQSYGPPERSIQAIIPLYEYQQLHYLRETERGVGHEQAKLSANAAKWDANSPLIAEKAVRLKNARIVLINYDLLKKDFPFLSTKKEDEIDQWVLDKAAFIAQAQVDKGVVNEVNTAIPTDDSKSVTAFRPYLYGRALLFPVTDDHDEPAGFIDVKGAGARDPKKGSHSNGLMALGECIREYNFENLVNRVLVHAHRNQIAIDGLPTETPTVGSYAVIYTGFSISPGDTPAGLYLRQAHTRWNGVELDPSGLSPVIDDVPDRAIATGGAGHMQTGTKVKLAKILALYDIWADENNDSGAKRFELADIQGTRDNRLFDFGAYLVGSNAHKDTAFANEIANHDRAKPVPFEQWGWEHVRDPAADRPWQWAHQTASAIAGYLANPSAGNEYRKWAENHFTEMITRPLADWNP